MALTTGWATETGQRRDENQDAVFVRQLDAGGALLAAVADGMGGLLGGSLASRTAITVLEAAAFPDLGPEQLVSAFGDAHQRIYRAASSAGEVRGTTLLAVLVRDASLYVANVGDCRAYILSGDTVKQVTKDHSVVAEQLEAGTIDEAEARSSPLRNVLTRALGPDEPPPKVDVVGPLLLRDDDCIVLCSDGLHTLVEPEEIAIAARELAPQAAAEALAQLANERGGFDNISVVVISVQEDALR